MSSGSCCSALVFRASISLEYASGFSSVLRMAGLSVSAISWTISGFMCWGLLTSCAGCAIPAVFFPMSY